MIIGLLGAKGCGKSTVFAKHLKENYNFTSVAHADPIKSMLMSLGLTEEHVNGYLKEVPCAELCGKTPRHAMQTLGSEWGRQLIHEDIWIYLWGLEALKYEYVIADGVRFKKEVDKIKELGGINIKIRRPSVEGQSTHDTEMYASVLKTDYEIFNEEDNPEKGIDMLDSIMDTLGLCKWEKP